MPATKELRHPDFLGLRLDRDPVHPAAVIAANAQARKPGLLEKRPGFRRMNQRRYTGAILLLDDLQRVCDYGKFLVVAGHFDLPPMPTFPGPDIHQHDPINDPGDPVFDPAWAPVAAASAAPSTGLVPLTVQFSSAGSSDPMGGPLAYFWDFGDLNTSNDPNPAHIYGAAGNYVPTLTVTNAAGKTATAGPGGITVTQPVVLGLRSSGGTRSTDGGASWNACAGLPANGIIWAVSLGTHAVVARSAYTPDRVEFYRSTDGGATFALVGSIVGNANLRPYLCVLPSGRILAWVQGTGVYYSDDEGTTWVASPWPGTIANTVLVNCDNQAPGNTYVLELNPSPGANGSVFRVWRSPDGGATWVLASTLAALIVPEYWNALYRLVPCGNNVLLACIGAMRVPPADTLSEWHRSTDGGATWAPIAMPFSVPPRDTYAAFVVEAASVLYWSYHVSPKQAWYSLDRGANWALANVVGFGTTDRQLVFKGSQGWYGACNAQLWRSVAVGGVYGQVATFPWTPIIILGLE